MNDLRFALRQLRKSPGFTAVVVFSLALGIGANTVVFSWIQWAIFKPLPGVSNTRALHVIEPRDAGGTYVGVSWRDFLDLRERNHAFTDIIAYRIRRPLSLGESGSDERVWTMFVSGQYFDFLELRPALGRFFRADEVAHPGGAPVVVISYQFWKTRLAGASDVVGRTLRLNERVVTIIGVAPEKFNGTFAGLAFEAWAPATMLTEFAPGTRELDQRDMRGFYVMGRLAPGITAAQAQAAVNTAMNDLAKTYPDTNRNLSVDVVPLWRAPRSAQNRVIGAFGTLQAIVLLVLLVVCANTANLLLARATVRRREIGVRLAIGASRLRILRQLLTESVVLAFAGGVGGVLVAMWGVNALRVAAMPGDIPISFEPDVDFGSLAFSLLLGAVCGIAFGLAPALQLGRTDLCEALRSGARDTGRNKSWSLRNLLVALQVALTLAVLVVTGIFLKSFYNARTLDPGFRSQGMLLASYDLTARGYDQQTGPAFLAELLRRLRAEPNVESAAVASVVPITFGGLPSMTFQTESAPASGTPNRTLFYQVTPGYFTLMGIPLVTGTDFVELGDRTRFPEVVINEEAARRFWPGESPIGRRIKTGSAYRDAYEVVGVVRTTKVETLSEQPKPMFYFSFRDRFWSNGTIHVRMRTKVTESAGADVKSGSMEIDSAPFVRALRNIVRDLDPNLPLTDIQTLSGHLENQAYMRRAPSRILAVLGPLTLVLAAIGVYSVLAYTVSQRHREIAVRLALGATPSGVARMVMREGLRLVLAGAFLGWFFALLLGFYLSRRVSNVAIGDPLLYFGIPFLLVTVAASACWHPARRASRIDPIVALRAE